MKSTNALIAFAMALLVALSTLLTPTATALAAPEPDPVPRSWEFRFEPGPLRVTSINIPGAGVRSFYYMPYLVENNTGEDRYFAPRFELVTDAGQILRSGREVPRYAADRIRQSLGNDLLLDEISVQGNLLQGDANAREAVVIWPADELDVDTVTVFAAGFSGENAIVTRPDNGETVVLRKTRMLQHTVAGRLNPRSDTPLQRDRIASRWIMR